MLDEKSKNLFQVIGIIIADNPKAIRELLEEYSIELTEKPTDKELTEKLLWATSECNNDFNSDLAAVILDYSLESAYDNFDFKSLFNKGGNSEEEGKSSGGGGGGGLLGNITNIIGKAGGTIAQGIKGREAKEEATAQTLQGIYSYKAQLAANQQSKRNNKMYVLISLFVLFGFALAATLYYLKKQSHQELIPLKPLVT